MTEMLQILTDIAKPASAPAMLQAFIDNIRFPNPLVHSPLTDITDLVSSLDTFLSTVYTFISTFNNDRNHLPITDKPTGLLYHLYRKMPHMLVLISILQHPMDKAIQRPDILDVIHHIRQTVTAYLKTPHHQAADFYAALPTPRYTPEPLLTRYPLYNGSSTPTPPVSSKRIDPPHQSEPPRRSDTNFPRYDNPYHPDSMRRPDAPKQAYPQRTQLAPPHPTLRQQHLLQPSPRYDTQYYSDNEAYDDTSPAHSTYPHHPPDQVYADVDREFISSDDESCSLGSWPSSSCCC